MTTVTAKQLREDLSAIMDRVENGEDIVVIRHSKPVLKLVPAAPVRGRSAQIAKAMKRYQAYVSASGVDFSAYQHGATKNLYHSALDTDAKYE